MNPTASMPNQCSAKLGLGQRNVERSYGAREQNYLLFFCTRYVGHAGEHCVEEDSTDTHQSWRVLWTGEPR